MILGTAAASAQDTAKPAMLMQETNAPMVPGLGEIMTLQQLRHIKLWFAGRAGNWPLADYEIGELNEGFEDVTQAFGRRYRGQGRRRPDAGAAEDHR